MKQMVKVMQGNAIYMQTYINKWTCSCHADAWGHTERCMKSKPARVEHREGDREREKEKAIYIALIETKLPKLSPSSPPKFAPFRILS